MDAEKIGMRLVKLRGNRTQEQISNAIGVAQSTYCMYETGQRIPSDEVKIKIAKFFKKSVQNIFFD